MSIALEAVVYGLFRAAASTGPNRSATALAWTKRYPRLWRLLSEDDAETLYEVTDAKPDLAACERVAASLEGGLLAPLLAETDEEAAVQLAAALHDAAGGSLAAAGAPFAPWVERSGWYREAAAQALLPLVRALRGGGS